MRGASDVLALVGRTPMVRLARLRPEGLWVVAKLEGMNPGGSVKDRLVLGLVRHLLTTGELPPGAPLIEATAGNLGVSLALCGNAMGVPVTLVMPEQVPAEHRRLVAGLGAEVVLSPGDRGMEGAVRLAEALRRERGGVGLNPFHRRESVEALRPLADEVAEGMPLPLRAVVAGVGTGATLMALAGLRRRWPDLKRVAVEPAESPVLSGGRPGVHRLPGLGPGFVPPVLDLSQVDRVEAVSTGEALEMAGRLARTEGVLTGPSGGAAVVAALRVAADLEDGGPGAVLVVLPDLGERYLAHPGFVGAPPPRQL